MSNQPITNNCLICLKQFAEYKCRCFKCIRKTCILHSLNICILNNTCCSECTHNDMIESYLFCDFCIVKKEESIPDEDDTGTYDNI